MRHGNAKASRVLCWAMASVGPLAGDAHAQTAGVSAPPAEQYSISPGGVDMRTGRYVYRQTDLGIGQAGDEPALELERIEPAGIPGHISPFANFASNWDVTLTERRQNLVSGQLVQSGSSNHNIYVNWGGRLVNFSAGGLELPLQQRSRGLAGKISHTGMRGAGGEIYTYTAPDGTRVVFRPLGLWGASDCSEQVRCAYASEIIQPDGEKFTLEYDVRSTGTRARLAAVTSNRGYVLIFEHNAEGWDLVSKACVLNLSETARPADNVCPAGIGRTASYAYVRFGDSHKLASVVDALQRNWAFSYATAPSSPSGYYKMGYHRPGEATPWLVNLIGLQPNYFMVDEDIVWRQDYADGASWTYSYDYTPTEIGLPPGQPTHQVAGGYYEDAAGHRTTVSFSFPEVPRSVREKRPGPSAGTIYSYYLNTPGDPLALVYAGSSSNPDGTVQDNYTVDSSSTMRSNFSDLMMTQELKALVQCHECSGISSYELVISYQITPGPTRVIDPLGRTTVFDYCDRKESFPAFEPFPCLVVGPVQSVTDPEGIKTSYTYSRTRLTAARRSAKAGSGLPDIVTSATYPSDCVNLVTCINPLTTTDPNGNTKTYVYDSVHGGVTAEIDPADANGMRPVRRYQYTLRRAWVRNGGGYSQSADGIYLLTGERMCLNSATSEPISYSSSCAAGSSDEVTTRYDYGPDTGAAGNNLLLRGKAVTSNGTTLRTCYGYDGDGNRIWETSPRAGQSACY